MDFKNEYKNKIKEIDNYIEFYLSKKYEKSQPELLEAMKYSVLNGGKRLRSILCIEICRTFGGNTDQALKFASAIELIHAYSLVHDDLPAMDNADMRRGQPSCHKKFGEAMGILCGDALLNSAYELMSSSCNNSSSVKAMGIVAFCAGANGMINGQVIDLEVSATKKYDEKILIKLIEQKTMALIRSAVISGAHLADCDEEQLEDMEKFAYSLGLAFQIRDDFEDMVEDADESCDSPNFVNFLGEENASTLLNHHSNISLDILKKYNNEFLILLHNYLFN